MDAGIIRAQALPEGPIQVFDGKVAVGAEVIATGGNADEIAFFNYTDYEHNALRMFRLGVSGMYHPANWLSFVGELRSEDLDTPNSVRSLRARATRGAIGRFDIQAGIIPPVFGSFGRRPVRDRQSRDRVSAGLSIPDIARSDAIPATLTTCCGCERGDGDPASQLDRTNRVPASL